MKHIALGRAPREFYFHFFKRQTLIDYSVAKNCHVACRGLGLVTFSGPINNEKVF
jgi:hypothetical protein